MKWNNLLIYNILSQQKEAFRPLHAPHVGLYVCNPLKGDAMITDRLYGIQFTEDAKEMSQGDKFMEVTLPFICTDIEYQSV